MGDGVGGRAIRGAAFDQTRGGAGARGLGRAGCAVGGGDRRLALGQIGPALGRVERIPAKAEDAEDLDAGHGKGDRGDSDQDPVDRRKAFYVAQLHDGAIRINRPITRPIARRIHAMMMT